MRGTGQALAQDSLPGSIPGRGCTRNVAQEAVTLGRQVVEFVTARMGTQSPA